MKSSRFKSCRIVAFVLVLCATFCAPGLSQAGLVINVVPADVPGNVPVMTGGGNLPDIMHAAAGFWMAAFPEVNWTVNLQYQWGGLTNAFNAQFVDPVVVDGHILSGNILFNNFSVDWYAPPDPHNIVNPAYGPLETLDVDYYGNLLNVGRAWNAVAGSPADGNLDLLMVAEHEIGHALGLYDPPAPSQEITISSEVSPEFAGFHVLLEPIRDHITNFTTPIMATGFNMRAGERKGISSLDILTVAEINGWERPNLDPYQVPEPASVVLMLMGVGLLWCSSVASLRRASLSEPTSSRRTIVAGFSIRDGKARLRK